LQGRTILLSGPGDKLRLPQIVENTHKQLKNQNKTSMAIRLQSASEIYRPLLGSAGPGPMYD